MNKKDVKGVRKNELSTPHCEADLITMVKKEDCNDWDLTEWQRNYMTMEKEVLENLD